MDHDKVAGAAHGSKLADTAANGCGMVARPRTVIEEINAAIEEHNRSIARLMDLRATAAARGIGGMVIDDLRQFAFPGNAIF